MPSVLGEALIKSNDEQRFEISIRTATEILSLAAAVNMENFLRKTIYLELFYFVTPALETMRAFGRHKLDLVFAKMEPSTTVIHHVSGSEFFMRVSNKEGCASSSLESFLKILKSFGEVAARDQ